MGLLNKFISDTRRLWAQYTSSWIGIGVYASLVGVFMLLRPGQGVFPYVYEVGKPWQYEDVYAPLDFRIVETTSASAQPMLQRSLPGIFRLDTSALRQWKQKDSLVPPPFQPYASRLAQYAYRYAYIDKPLELFSDSFFVFQVSTLDEYHIPKLSVVDSSAIRRWIESHIPESLQSKFYSWVVHNLPPNAYWDSTSVDWLIQETSTPPLLYKGEIYKGQRIIRQGEVVTPELHQTLAFLQKSHAEEFSYGRQIITFLGSFLLSVLTLSVLVWYFIHSKRHIYLQRQQMNLLLSTYLLVLAVGLAVLHLQNQISYHHVVPIAMAPLLLTIFFDERVGFISALVLTSQVTLLLRESIGFFFIHGISGALAVFPLRVLRYRKQFYAAIGTLGFMYGLTYLGYQLYQNAPINKWDLFFLGLNVIFCLVTYPMIYLMERLFGLWSDVSFMELLDTHHPLLQKLAREAPGTFQHSLQVATLAEAAAMRIGAHPLKAHVYALYHDIGKLHNPELFIENQRGINPHQHLSPLESAQGIIYHVAYGEKLAREYGLPTEVLDAIRTHHGTTWVIAFWNQHLLRGGKKEDESAFRYPGPTPMTKELGILMLADSVEAACRSLTHPTPEEIQSTIERIIEARIADGQLTNSDISLLDLERVKKVFREVMTSVYHSRVPYPKITPEEANPAKVLAEEKD
ncbi:MAG: HD family phosphohydrolase [Bacteroidia bacterium]